MPQPLIKDDGLNFNPEAVKARPQLAVHVAVIAGIVTNIEMVAGTFVAAMLGEDAELGSTAFLAIENEGSRLAVMRALAERILAPEDIAGLNNIFKKLRERRPDRNIVIHGVWGTSPHHPDALIYIDPRDFIHWMASQVTSTLKNKQQPVSVWTKAKVYVEQDFIDIENRLEAFRKEASSFWSRVVKTYPIASISQGPSPGNPPS